MLSDMDSNQEFFTAINPKTALKDDVKNQFLTNHLIPFIEKVELWYISIHN
jgi:hypothetical protein